MEHLRLRLNGMDLTAAELLALHGSELQNLRRLRVWKTGSGGYDVNTACGVSSALLVLLMGAKGLEELTLRVPVSLYFPPLSNIQHLTLIIFHQAGLGTVMGALSERACASLANLRHLQTLTLSKDAHSAAVPHNCLRLQDMRLQSVLLDGIPLMSINVAPPCALHLVVNGNAMAIEFELAVLASTQMASTAVQTLCATIPNIAGRQRLGSVLTCLSQLTYLHLDVHERVSGMVEIGDAAPRLEILNLTGNRLAVNLGAASRLRILWVCGSPTLELGCDMPGTVASSLTYVHISFSCVQGLGVFELLSSMQAAGKRVHPVTNRVFARLSPQVHTLARYPQDRLDHMMQLFCLCHACRQQSINDRMQACSVLCGNLRHDHTGDYRYS